MKKIAIVHFTIYPVIGGVEVVIDQHARLLADKGYDVEIFCAEGKQFDKRVKVTIVPEIDVRAEENMKIRTALEKENKVVREFDLLSEKVYRKFRQLLAGKDFCILHNIQSNQLHIPGAAAFRKLAEELDCRFIAWCHDHVLTTPYYADKSRDKYPWSIIGEKDKNMQYVVVSETQQKKLSKLFGVPEKELKVVPNGVPIKGFLTNNETIYRIFEKYGLFSEKLVMLMPSRVVPRKNIEYGIKLLAEIRKKLGYGKVVLTGRAHAQRPELEKYYHDLKDMAKKLGLEKYFIFLSEIRVNGRELYIDDEMIRDLFYACDMLLFPSKQEGFGIPLLEAAMVRMPAVVSNIDVHVGLGIDHIFIDIAKEPREHVDKIAEFCENNTIIRNRKFVLNTYSWDSIYENTMKHLFE